jgi:hypothetical protein
MPAPKGNKYWEARSSHGRNPIFASPDELLKSCTEYFNHADDNPIVSYKPYVTNGAVEQMETIHKRPYTLEGLYVFVGISLDGFRDYEKREGFIEVCKEVRQTIRDQKLSGAMVGIFQHNIVARDIQLRDGVDSKVEAVVTLQDMSEDELDAELRQLDDN